MINPDWVVPELSYKLDRDTITIIHSTVTVPFSLGDRPKHTFGNVIHAKSFRIHVKDGCISYVDGTPSNWMTKIKE